MFDLGFVNYTDPAGETHQYLEWALSAETADHHFGGTMAGVHRPGEEPAKLKRDFELHECERPRPPGAEVKKGTDIGGNDHPWSLFISEVSTPIWYCPFCGEKMSIFPPEH